MTLYEKEEVRAAAVQAAAQMLGEAAWWRRDAKRNGIDIGTEYVPSPALQQLTEHVATYIARGRWEVGG
jgi:hypothetical protein